MNVAVISSQVLMRRAFCALLAQVRDVRVVADFDRAIENSEGLRRANAELVMIDVLDPQGDLDTAAQLRQLLPDAKVLLLTNSDEEDFQVQAIKVGVRGCFSKSSELHAFERALRAIGQRGEVWVSHQVAAQIIGKFAQEDGSQQAPASHLTQREWEILALVANGCHNKEIAGRLFISENTVKTHLYTIYKKLGVSSRLGAAMHYFQQAKRKSASKASRPVPSSPSISDPAPEVRELVGALDRAVQEAAETSTVE